MYIFYVVFISHHVSFVVFIFVFLCVFFNDGFVHVAIHMGICSSPVFLTVWAHF